MSVSILKITSKIFERFIFKKIRTLWNLSPQNNSAVFEKATAHNIAFYSRFKNINQVLLKEDI